MVSVMISQRRHLHELWINVINIDKSYILLLNTELVKIWQPNSGNDFPKQLPYGDRSR